MLFHSIGAIALLLSGAQARIVGFKIPKTIKAGDKFKVATRSDSIAATLPPADEDVVANFGYAPVASAEQGTLGKAIFTLPWDDIGTYIYYALYY
ncbi:hypothetical protein IMZ48_49855 [Candidatus Bathyarchaeota archaeon]|nr:hypothetical protein [Candidatus Bathyarchaeota archaeon]